MRRSSFIFKENHLFTEEDNHSDKVVTVEKELDGIDIDVGILTFSLMVESLLKVKTERRGQKLYKPIDVNSVINAIDEIEIDVIFLAVTFGVTCK